jgi:single-strand DNA-binding protein
MLTMIAAGRLGRDAETRHGQDGTAYTSFSLAVDQGKDKTVWVSCTIKGDRGEKLKPHLTKGQSVAVIGFPQATVFQKQDGTNQADLKLWVDRLTFQGGGQKAEGQPQKSGQSSDSWQPPADLDDEIPF